MSGHPRYSPKLRDRAVRMVRGQREDYKSQRAAVSTISNRFGMSPEALRTCVRRAQVDGGTRPGLSSDERARGPRSRGGSGSIRRWAFSPTSHLCGWRDSNPRPSVP